MSDGKTYMSRIEHAMQQCHEAGKEPAVVLIGGKASVAVLAFFRRNGADNIVIHREATDRPDRALFATVPIRIRPTLNESVIVESTDGEPFICEPGEEEA